MDRLKRKPTRTLEILILLIESLEIGQSFCDIA